MMKTQRLPYKIIHKYKNIQACIGYNIYIFVGEHIPMSVKKILNKIRDLSLIETLQQITLSEFKSLVEQYTDSWYIYFFNKYHINYTRSLITKNLALIKNLQIPKKWIDNNFIDKPEVFMPAVGYAEKINIKRKHLEKLLSSKNIKQMRGSGVGSNEILRGGFEELDNEDENNEEDLEEINMEDVDVDTNSATTQKNISNIINIYDKKHLDHINKLYEAFSMEYQNQSLDKVYNKIFIFDQFIYDNDTIYNVKLKLANNVRLPNEYALQHITPSRMYLWSEYFYQNKIENIILGHKIFYKNTLIKMPIVPNDNILLYQDLSTIAINEMHKLFTQKIHRIKTENDDYNILNEYKTYIMNNEIMFVDIFLQLSLDFDMSDKYLSNFSNTYMRMYFPKSIKDLHNIHTYLRDKSNDNYEEVIRSKNISNTTANDINIEKYIVDIVETLRLQQHLYKDMFYDIYVTHCTLNIYMDLKFQEREQIKLWEIFNNFEPNHKFPFLLLRTSYEPIRKIYKYQKDDIDHEQLKHMIQVMESWISKNKYGLSFKVKTNDARFISINISINGKIQLKIQWKENNQTKIDEIPSDFIYIKQLFEKINKDLDDNHKLPIPKQHEYDIAFINSIQNYSINFKNKNIDHNELSMFASYFYPYVSVIIDPNKREKINNKDVTKFSKYGTYLRYKKISGYDDVSKIQQRIHYYYRNYNVDNNILIKIIAKEFNILEEDAQKYITSVPNIYNNQKKKQQLKQLSMMPKFKQSGVIIEIQGKTSDKYKIKVSGASSVNELHEIFMLINIILYLYKEIYIMKSKNAEYIKFVNEMKKLQKIAKLRNKVEVININDVQPENELKALQKLDPSRLSTDKFIKGNAQWARECQKIGNINRRPQQQGKNIFKNNKELEAAGYNKNKQTGYYEKTVKHPITNKNVPIKAIKLDDLYYGCHPDTNNEYMHVGVLSKVKTKCRPCCFKNDQFLSNDLKIQKNFVECSSGTKYIEVDDDNEEKKNVEQMLYIRQYTNKIIDNRLFFLPEVLDILFNSIHGKNILKSHKLEEAKDGYFFTLGINTISYKFITAISKCLDLSIVQLQNKLFKVLKDDKKLAIFTSLNSGKIRVKYESVDNYIKTIKLYEKMSNIDFDSEYNLLVDLISIVFNINIIVFAKVSNDGHNKYSIIDKYYSNNTNQDYDFYLKQHELINFDTKSSVFLIHDESDFYPIIEIIKMSKGKEYIQNSIFKHDNVIIEPIKDFYVKNTGNNILVNNKVTITDFIQAGFTINLQILDVSYQTVFAVVSNKVSKLLVKLSPKRIDYTIDFIHTDSVDAYKNSISTIANAVNKEQHIVVKSSYYLNGQVLYLVFQYFNKNIVFEVPIKETSIMEFKKYFPNVKLIELPNPIQSDTHKSMQLKFNIDMYKEESYNLLRYELSTYLENNIKHKQELIGLSKGLDQNNQKIKDFLYNIVSDFVHIEDITEDSWIKQNQDFLQNFSIDNVRVLCLKKTKQVSKHCYQNKLYLLKQWYSDYITRLANEFAFMTIDAKEILKIDEHFVSYIVNMSNYNNYDKSIIVKGDNVNIKSVLDKVFQSNIVMDNKKLNVDETNNNHKNIIQESKDYFYQKIINNDDTIYRVLVNVYFLSYIQKQTKRHNIKLLNLGFKTKFQTLLTTFFKGEIIQYMLDNFLYKNNSFPELLKDYTIDKKLLLDFTKKVTNNKHWLLIMYIFHVMTQTNIGILYNFNTLQYIIKNTDIKKNVQLKDINTSEYLWISLNVDDNNIPYNVYALYYK